MNTRSARSNNQRTRCNTSENTSAQGTSSSSAQGTTVNPTGQTSNGNATLQSPNIPTGGASGANTSTTQAPSMSPPPMTVDSIPPLTFYEIGETFFMDDKHIDATHPHHANITQTQVDNLHQQFRQHLATWSGFPLCSNNILVHGPIVT